VVVEYPLLLVAADLAGAATYTSLPVPCRGAHSVAFHLASTDGADVAQSYTIQVRKAALQGVAAGAWQTVGAGSGGVVATTPTPAVLNAGGQVCSLTGLASATSGPTVIQGWDEARILVLGHATNVISGLSCRAQVIKPDGAMHVDTSVTATST